MKRTLNFQETMNYVICAFGLGPCALSHYVFSRHPHNKCRPCTVLAVRNRNALQDVPRDKCLVATYVHAF
jgi:hypothetical protein